MLFLPGEELTEQAGPEQSDSPAPPSPESPLCILNKHCPSSSHASGPGTHYLPGEPFLLWACQAVLKAPLHMQLSISPHKTADAQGPSTVRPPTLPTFPWCCSLPCPLEECFQQPASLCP